MSLDRAALAHGYRQGLLEDVVPFWLRHAIDTEHGGYLHCLDRDGTVLDTDKGIWVHGRFVWLLSTLHATLPDALVRAEWLDAARHGIEFLRAHAFDADGRVRFQVTRDGRPLRTRRYPFSEAFVTMAYAAYADASGDLRAAAEAREVFGRFLDLVTRPGSLPSKVDPGTRPTRSIGVPMITLNVAQVLRETIGDDRADAAAREAIEAIERDFVRPELEAVLETVAADGAVLDHFDGRTLNPGHAIEAAWFILHEVRRHGGDERLVDVAADMVRWMWRRGWDAEHGGLLYFVDLHGRPVQEYWHDMKFWWPHCETIVATLLAHAMTGDEGFADMHERVHEWTMAHFPDPQASGGAGEWFGYRHRDGCLSTPLKGNLWKGPFHVPRMQWYCWRLLEEERDG